jgi:hypothetical protein
MPCRDYEHDYEMWLQRGREHLENMKEKLRQLCQAARQRSLEMPPSVAKWWAEQKAGKEASLSKKVFDQTAQMLCLMCQVSEEKSLEMPPSVAAWWVEHKARDEQPDDLEKGLAHSPGFASFWEEYAAREAQIPGINHLDAVRALEKAGFRILRQGKTIVMTNGTRQLIIPRHDPVNAFAMARIIGIAGLEEEEFLKLL